jgi:hypothetical protein
MNTEAKKDRLVGMKFTIAVIGSRVERLKLKWALCRALFCGLVWPIYAQFALVACSSALGTKNVRGDRQSVHGHDRHDPRLARHPTWRLTRSVGNILLVIRFTGPFYYMYIV